MPTKVFGMAPATHGLLGRILRANDDASRRFGENTAEVDAFIHTAAQLTPWQWRQILTARRLVSTVTKEDVVQATESLQAVQTAIRSTDRRLSEPMSKAGESLFEALDKRSDDKVATAGQALTREKCELLAGRWRLDAESSRALLQVVAKTRYLKPEEAAALIALRTIPTQLTGDLGWAAVKTVVHGGRVLGARAELSKDQIPVLWAPLEAAIPWASIEEHVPKAVRARVRAAVDRATAAITKPPIPAATAGTTSPPSKRSTHRAPGPYGPNNAEVATFIKGVVELTPIQWLRVLDRRQLVATVTRQTGAEPAGVVRSLFGGDQRHEGARHVHSLPQLRRRRARSRDCRGESGLDIRRVDARVRRFRGDRAAGLR